MDNTRELTNPTDYDNSPMWVEPFSHIGQKVNLLLRTGTLLLENGANANHITRDMLRVAAYMGIPSQYLQIHLTHATIMVNINDGNHSYTAFLRAPKRVVNMTILSAISKLTWSAVESDYSLEKYESELNRISALPFPYASFSILLAAISCGGFAVLFGGSWMAALVTAICAGASFYTHRLTLSWKINAYLCITIASFVATSLAYASIFVTGNKEAMIYAMMTSTLFMIPGVPLINAVDDMLNSFSSSALGRFLHTLLIVGGMALGITMTFYFDNISNANMLGEFTNLSIAPSSISLKTFLAAALSATGYAMLFNTPSRLLPCIALGGLISVSLRNILILYFDFSFVGATFLGAAAISIMMLRLSTPLKTTSTVLTIPSVIAMVPGVLIYRFLFSLMHIDELDPYALLQAERSGLTGLFTLIAIAVGTTVPTLVAMGYMDKKKILKLQNFLSKRKP